MKNAKQNPLEQLPDITSFEDSDDESETQKVELPATSAQKNAQRNSKETLPPSALKDGSQKRLNKPRVSFNPNSQDEYSYSQFSDYQRVSASRYSFASGSYAFAIREINVVEQPLGGEPEERTVEALILYHDNDDTEINDEDTIDRVWDEDTFNQAIRRHKQHWFPAVFKYVDLALGMNLDQEKANELLQDARTQVTAAEAARDAASDKMDKVQAELQAHKAECMSIIPRQELEDFIAGAKKAVPLVERLRKEKSAMKATIAKQEKEITDRKNTYNALWESIGDGGDPPDFARPVNSTFDDSEDDSPPPPPPPQPAPRDTRGGTPGTTMTGLTSSGRAWRAKYPDPEKFKGEFNSEGELTQDWERWYSQVIAKLDHDYDGADERDKVNYVRDRTESNAFNEIRERAIAGSTNPYDTINELLEDLETAYGDIDREGTAIAKLTAGKLQQSKKEPISQWASRFKAACRRGDINDRTMRSYALQNIDKEYLTHFQMGGDREPFEHAINRLRKAERELNLVAKGPATATTKKTTGGGVTGSTSGGAKKTTSGAPRINKCGRTDDQVTKCMKKGLCLRCLEKGHVQHKCTQTEVTPWNNSVVDAAPAAVAVTDEAGKATSS